RDLDGVRGLLRRDGTLRVRVLLPTTLPKQHLQPNVPELPERRGLHGRIRSLPRTNRQRVHGVSW
ncbi:MAG: hypothetical protein JSV06_07335, partial [Myxococcales bacterium]